MFGHASSDPVRERAVLAIASLGTQGAGAGKVLLECASQDARTKIRILALGALGKLGGAAREHLPALLDLRDSIKDETSEVRRAILRAETAIRLGR